MFILLNHKWIYSLSKFSKLKNTILRKWKIYIQNEDLRKELLLLYFLRMQNTENITINFFYFQKCWYFSSCNIFWSCFLLPHHARTSHPHSQTSGFWVFVLFHEVVLKSNFEGNWLLFWHFCHCCTRLYCRQVSVVGCRTCIWVILMLIFLLQYLQNIFHYCECQSLGMKCLARHQLEFFLVCWHK